MPARFTVTFSRPVGADIRKGPFARLRLEGELMRAEAGGPVVARHVEHSWQVDGEVCTRAELDGTVTLHFERVDGIKSKTYGPFASVSFVDGVAYAEREVFAFADRSIVDWYCHDDGQHYPLMIIEPVG